MCCNGFYDKKYYPIQKNSCVNAMNSPCANHAINLSISKFLNVKLVRDIADNIKKVLSFFNMSSKTLFYFDK